MTRPLLLVTGIAEGLGAEIAAAFARAGHDVIGLSRGTTVRQQSANRSNSTAAATPIWPAI